MNYRHQFVHTVALGKNDMLRSPPTVVSTASSHEGRVCFPTDEAYVLSLIAIVNLTLLDFMHLSGHFGVIAKFSDLCI